MTGNGNRVAKYTYDPWGKPLSITDGDGNAVGGNHIANLNPLRYRGYYYDTETGLYYLQSRYYDPTTGRFLNADEIIAGVGGNLRGYNQFAYCFNNPIGMSDRSGQWPMTDVLARGVELIIEGLESVFTIRYDVPLYFQNGYRLCWAYCQAMIEDFKSGIVRNQEEVDARAKEIAIKRKGPDDWNTGSYPKNIKEVDSTSIYDLYNALKLHGPLYAKYGYYINDERKKGHAVVVTGVDLLRGRVYTNNPWKLRGDQSFEEFIFNFVGKNELEWYLDGCFYLS